MSLGDQIAEERRRRRRACDPRLSYEGREALRRMTTGDLADEFQQWLDDIAASEPALSGDQLDDT